MTDANFQMVTGDTRVLRVSVKDVDGNVVDLTDVTEIVWQVARSPFGNEPVLIKTLGDGIAFSDRPNGLFDVTLDPPDTVALSGLYFHFARITSDESGVSTVFLGTATISPAAGAVTREMFLARFPEFAAVNPATLQMVLDEVAAQVGLSWREQDRSPAMLYLAAHILTMEGEPGRSIAIASGNMTTIVSGPMKRRKVGDVEVEYSGAGRTSSSGGSGNSGNSGTVQSTAYGRQYMIYLRRNFGGPVVV